MDCKVGDVIQTTQWTHKWNGLYVILEVLSNGESYRVRQIFCSGELPLGKRSFSAGINEKIGHIDDLTNFAAD